MNRKKWICTAAAITGLLLAVIVGLSVRHMKNGSYVSASELAGQKRAEAPKDFLLYSPAHDGGHIKWPPVRAELAINLARAGAAEPRPANKGQVCFSRFYLRECRGYDPIASL